jgi:hypothetical protein
MTHRISVTLHDTVQGVTVDLDALPTDLARTVRAARLLRGHAPATRFISAGPDPIIGEWARSILASGELDFAIAEVAGSDPDLAL